MGRMLDFLQSRSEKSEWYVRKASHSGSKKQYRSCAAISLLNVRDIYMGVNLRAHPVRGESHIQRNATGEVATLHTVPRAIAI